MFPVLFSIGPLTIHTYGFLVALGALVGLLVSIRGSDASGVSRQQVMDMIFMIILCAIVGSRLTFVLMNYTYFLERPLAAFKLWEGGLVFSGGFFRLSNRMILVSPFFRNVCGISTKTNSSDHRSIVRGTSASFSSLT